MRASTPTNPSIKETDLAKSYLAEFENITLSNCIVSERKAFRDAMLQGLSVFEMQESKAKEEMVKLCEEILSIQE